MGECPHPAPQPEGGVAEQNSRHPALSHFVILSERSESTAQQSLPPRRRGA